MTSPIAPTNLAPSSQVPAAPAPAPAAAAVPPVLGSARHCVFSLAGRQFGLEVDLVSEIALVPPVTPVPHAPPSVRGCVNLRGQICLIIDPRPVLGYSPGELSFANRLLVLRPGAFGHVGLLVDGVGDVAAAPAGSIEPIGAIATDASPMGRFLLAAVKADELIWILDIRALLAAVERDVAAASDRERLH